jgi:hypothetical protein
MRALDMSEDDVAWVRTQPVNIVGQRHVQKLTFEVGPAFKRDFVKLPPAEQREFQAAYGKLIYGLATGKPDPMLHSRQLAGQRDIWEMTWAPDRRLRFSYQTPDDSNQLVMTLLSISSHDLYFQGHPQPRYYTTDEFLRHLGATEEEIEEAKKEAAREE